MLTLIEKIVFLIAVVISAYLSFNSFSKMIRIINKGQGSLSFENMGKRISQALSVLLLQNTVLKKRFWLSLIHALIAWAFILYFLVNFGDILYAYIPNFHFMGQGTIGNIYRLFVDIFSVLAIVGVAIYLMRRFVFKSSVLTIRENVTLMNSAKNGMKRDSLIVGFFIIGHVGFRFLGESFVLANNPDAWQPLASFVSLLWINCDQQSIIIHHHASWWAALGLILAFIPYFPKSKHIHLMVGPFNFLSKPDRSSPGTMDKLDFEAEDAEQFGVSLIEQLDKTGLVDAYACIMCNRCQDVCPAYTTGKELSPSALEINKRYYLNEKNNLILDEEKTSEPLLDWAISESALWACTSCAACVEVCPVGNEPMFDILNIRRDRVLMESKFPKELQTAFNGMERNGNPWNINKDRLEWVKEDESLVVKTVDQNPDFEILYWVGCAGAFDQRGGDVARAFTKILNKANVNFSVLGNKESCTGDSARRTGNEYLFSMLTEGNVENLNAAKVKKIVTTCPHCLHTLKNEYPQFGGNYEVIHHSQLIDDLQRTGKLEFNNESQKVTFHDPCYLGRHNNVFNEPRQVLSNSGLSVNEMDRNRNNSFCCGAGAGNMWKEEEEGQDAVRRNRFKEAESTGSDVICVGCPFCKTMLNDAGNELESKMEVKDIAEIIAEKLV